MIVDYEADFSAGEMFLIQAADSRIMVGNYIRKQQRETLHFADA
ncbi:hypothetical protein PQR14_11920 [Paraburkholderia bryophila]